MTEPAPAILVVGESDQMSVVDRSDLVPDVNRAFLMARRILPIELDQGRLLCLAVDPTDSNAQDAMRFASGREVILIAALPETILAAFNRSDDAAPPVGRSLGRHDAIPHAREVVWLRERLAQVATTGGDALVIDRSGAIVIRQQGQDIDTQNSNAAQAERLIAAIDALTEAGPHSDDRPGFDIMVGTTRYRALVVGSDHHRIIQLPMS